MWILKKMQNEWVYSVQMHSCIVHHHNHPVITLTSVRLSVCLSVPSAYLLWLTRQHSSKRRGQRTFRSNNKKDRHTCFVLHFPLQRLLSVFSTRKRGFVQFFTNPVLYFPCTFSRFVPSHLSQRPLVRFVADLSYSI